MPTTATWGLPYPTDASVADVPADIQALAEAVDTDLTSLDGRLDTLEALKAIGAVNGFTNVKIVYGSGTYSMGSGDTGQFPSPIGFGVTFSAAPVLLAVAGVSSSTQSVTISVTSVTTSNFNVTFKNTGGTDQTNQPWYWIAIGRV